MVSTHRRCRNERGTAAGISGARGVAGNRPPTRADVMVWPPESESESNPSQPRETAVSRTPQEIFQSYVMAGAISRDADALAANFTEDAVFEAPLVPPGAAFPGRLVGREEIRSAMAAYYAKQAQDGGGRTPSLAKSGYVLHTTADPDVFIAEIDTVFDGPEDGDGDGDGGDEVVSLVQIFRIRDGRIARLRDYFAPRLVD
ncbi:hypothetical protein GCM10010505_14450 [Kitasatospora aburaviensis]